jgi:hypothetical protein
MTRKYAPVRTVLTLAALAILATGAALYAGPLNPPAGPVTNTGKALAEVEPRTAINAINTPGDNDASPSLFKISQPGSYYLTGNITGVAGRHGIEIAASGVTLDLNGFEILGDPAGGVFDGVSLTGVNLQNISVVNGSVRSWGDDGVDLSGINSRMTRVDRIITTDNTDRGIEVGDVASRITNCITAGNGGDGVNAGDGTTIADCLAYDNGGRGFDAEFGVTFVNNVARDNVGDGFNASSGCSFASCVAYSNTGNGFSASFGCSFSNCTAYLNDLNGFALSSQCSFQNCTAYAHDLNGFVTGDGCTITNCAARSNGDNGMSVGDSCTLIGNSLVNNSQNGIVAASGCLILHNTLKSNGLLAGDGANILVTGSDSRVESNNCSLADRGIDIDGTGNLIISNSCSGNTTNYDIVASNRYGQIVSITAAGSAAVVGNSAVSTLTTTEPHANFAY